MKIKEIISYHLYEDRDEIDIEVVLENEEDMESRWLELSLEDLDEELDIFEEKSWIDFDEDDSVDLKGDIDIEKLTQALETYLEENPFVIND